MKTVVSMCFLLFAMQGNAQVKNSEWSADVANSIERNRMLKEKEIVGKNAIGDYAGTVFINDSTKHADKIKLQFKSQGIEVLIYVQQERLVLINENGAVYYFAEGKPYRAQGDKIEKAVLKRIEEYGKMIQTVKSTIESKE